MSSSDAKPKNSTDPSPEEQSPVNTPVAGALTYNGYLRVQELKKLQVCQSDPAHHDEPLFIIIHQTYELWFKLILHEIDEVFSMLEQDRVRRASFYMRRAVAIMRLLVQQIHILETMTPRDFLGFRYDLSPASGFGSSQFREIEFAAGAKHLALLEHFRGDDAYETLKRRYEGPSIGDAFYAFLRGKGFTLPEGKPGMTEQELTEQQDKRIHELLKLYIEEDSYGDWHDFAETMIDLDEQIFLWRANHVTVVERMIGFKRGTGGSEGVGYLQSTLSKRCFPDLWKLRTFLEPEANGNSPSAGSKPPDKCPFH
jgi:tryptophan 2,3-dioxygenase